MREQLVTFIVEELGATGVPIEGDTSLFKSKLLDSMNLTFLISFIETTFAVSISAMDVVFENFDSIDNLESFINRKRANG